MKNRLDPDLKRLMTWSRNDPSPQSEEPPLGFISRVVASLNRPAPVPSLLFQLQQSAWSSVWVSGAILVLGLIVLLNQTGLPRPASDFSSGLSFLASNLTQ